MKKLGMIGEKKKKNSIDGIVQTQHFDEKIFLTKKQSGILMKFIGEVVKKKNI